MEVAVAEHKRRMAMPMQQDLKIATINRAKCSKLSDVRRLFLVFLMWSQLTARC